MASGYIYLKLWDKNCGNTVTQKTVSMFDKFDLLLK
jgi:hypothetical protein